MLAAGSATKVLAGDENLTLVYRRVHHELLLGVALLVEAPVAEEIFAKTLACCSLEKAGGDNLVGVDVFNRQRYYCRTKSSEFISPNLCYQTFYINSLGSVTTPVIAAAAATSGPASIVRESGP